MSDESSFFSYSCLPEIASYGDALCQKLLMACLEEYVALKMSIPSSGDHRIIIGAEELGSKSDVPVRSAPPLTTIPRSVGAKHDFRRVTPDGIAEREK